MASELLLLLRIDQTQLAAGGHGSPWCRPYDQTQLAAGGHGSPWCHPYDQTQLAAGGRGSHGVVHMTKPK